MLQDYDLKQLVIPLREWFAENARILPWREHPSAYYVWISEIMLQQTRVEAVKPYFSRFVEALPDVRALAGCPEDQYLKLWEGLGYYSRVRNLHAAAVQIMEEYDGTVPDSVEQLLKLKGIGSYTAGAICSLAYEQPVPAVDGNVLRVLTRVSGDDTDILQPKFRRAVEDRLGLLLEEICPGMVSPRIFNQALMELGALVCVPNGTPRCGRCPWQPFCTACREHRTEELPVRIKTRGRRIEPRTVLLLEKGRDTAIRKRPVRGLLAGLYEYPNFSGHYTQEEALEYVRSIGLKPLQIRRLADSRHIFTHMEWQMIAYEIRVEDDPDAGAAQTERFTGESLFFVNARELLSQYALPSAFAAYKPTDRQSPEQW